MVLFTERLGGEEGGDQWKGFSVSHVRMRNGAVRAVVEATNLGVWGEVKIGDLYLGVVRVGWIYSREPG